MSAGNGLPGEGGRMRAAPVWEQNPHVVRRFHFLPKAESHVLQRFAAQLPRISYAIGG